VVVVLKIPRGASGLASQAEKCTAQGSSGQSPSPAATARYTMHVICLPWSKGSHVMGQLGYLYWVAMHHHGCHTSCHAIVAQISASPKVQSKVTRSNRLVLPVYPSFSSQHDFLILRTVEVAKERGLNSCFAHRNGLRDAFNLSKVPLNAVHVTMYFFHKSL
jgi:hypothetical protein